MLLPIGHERQTVQRLPWVTFALIGICILVYVYTDVFAARDDSALGEKVDNFFHFFSAHPYLEMPPEMGQFLTPSEHETITTMRESVDRTSLDPDVVRSEQAQLESMAAEVMTLLNENPIRKWGYIPADPHFINLFTCTFVHTGFWHLFGNMLFLFLAGCAIEDLWGRPLFLGFYLLGGIAATITHDLKFSSSAVPIVGASGAIAAVMGAFLVRLARTRIRFFYFFWVRVGTFEAPAFIMLPLWFLQQIVYASLTDESAGVAFWAHIGGFAFGVAFALGMKSLKIEEKYIASKLESKVSLAQNPLFLQAMDLSEKGDYPPALILLQKVVRQDPTHLDAFMEMRRIYEIIADREGYSAACAGILDATLKMHDPEMILGNYERFMQSPLHSDLPARTLLGLGTFFEEQKDFDTALQTYNELSERHESDPLSMKGFSKLARIYLEQKQDHEKGEEAFRKAYLHPMATEEWKKALRIDMKRYGIDATAMESGQRSVAPSAPVAPPPPPAVAVPPARPAADARSSAPSGPPVAGGAGVLPSPEFDGPYSGWTVVACRVGKPGLKGLSLQNAAASVAMLPWKRIRFLSAANVRALSSGAPGAREGLVLDLITDGPSGGRILYRTTGRALDFQQVFPGVQQTFFDAYENFIGIVLSNSGAVCAPDRESCTGPIFPQFPDLPGYERRLRELLDASGTKG